jgi:hypothetical protein
MEALLCLRRIFSVALFNRVPDNGFSLFRCHLPWVGEIDLVMEPCLAEITDIAVLRQKFVSGTISASLIPTKKIT